jgi:coenzyme F420-dependent glucose-6-phosphate dehydrogenase
LPDEPPRLLGAAVETATAEWVASWADGLITTGRPRHEMQETIAAFERGGGKGKPIVVQHTLSWARTDDEARRAAHEQWRFSALRNPDRLWDLQTPSEFAAATNDITVDDVARKIPCYASVEKHAEALRAYVDLGVNEVYLFNVNQRNQREFIERFGSQVMPSL